MDETISHKETTPPSANRRWGDGASGRMLCCPLTLSPSAFLITVLVLLLFFAFPLNTLAEVPTISESEQQKAAISVTNANQRQMRIALLSRINEIRAENGLPPYRFNGRLNQAAQAHVTDCYNRNNYSHRGSDGSGYYERIRRTGYIPAKANETVGRGNNVEWQINRWMSSRIHRAIILSTQYEDIGIGYIGTPNSRRDHAWVVKYARHR